MAHWSVRKCPGVALVDLGDVEGFDRSGEEDEVYAFQLLDLDKLFIGPVSLKRLRFTPGELLSDHTAVIIGQLPI